MNAPVLRWLSEEPGAGTRLFRLCAAVALGLHALLALGRSGIHGGGDLVPHLRLIELTQQQPGIHNSYAPGYHLLGALLEPLLGFEGYTKLFSLVAAALLIAGFRSFQRAAGLPDAASALFALTPYLLALTTCTPKVEAAGYAVLLFGLGALLRGQRVALALLLALCFWLHTASALLFGLAAGVLCLARGDARSLAALAAGTVAAAPLVVAQLAAGCSLPQALLFAQGGYARGLHEGLLPANWAWIVPLANPVAVGAAVLGARSLWERDRALGILCAVLVVLYLNNFWLAPFDLRTLVTPIRGLSMLAIPIAIAAGVWIGARPRATAWVAGVSLAWALGASVWVVPEACFVRRISAAEIAPVMVERCLFVWRGPPAPGTRRRP